MTGSLDIDVPAPTLSVVIPARDATGTLQPCLDAVVAGLAPADEVIVVDDASVRHVPASPHPSVEVVRLPRNVGRGPARNIGAARTTGEVLVFVDADVVLRDGALAGIRRAFTRSACTSLIGSYDDTPGDPGLVSQYRNLLHHHTHGSRGPTAQHFWTGIGAVRRDVFDKVGGLDEGDWARDMEDVEFGQRLVSEGFVIEVHPEVQGTHLKAFTVGSMVRTDLLHRAVPWTTLLLRTRPGRDTFVLSTRQAVSSAAVLGVLVGSLRTALGRRRARPTHAGRWIALPATAFLAANEPLWRFLRTERGLGFTLAAIPLHALHAACAAAGFAIGALTHLARRGGRPMRPATATATAPTDVPA